MAAKSGQNYQSDDLINFLHGFYHYGGANEFDPENQDYLIAIGAIGGAVVVVGALAIIAYFIFLCCRSLLACCRVEACCGANVSRLVLFLLMSAMVLTTLCSYVGYTNFEDSMNNLVDNFTNLKDTVQFLDDNSGTLFTQGVTMLAASKAVGCDPVTSKVEQMLLYYSDIFTIHAEIYTEALPPAALFGNFINLFADEFLLYIKMGLAFVAGVASVTFLFNVAGNLCRSSLLLNFSSFLSVSLFALYSVLVALEMALSVLFADFCDYGPNEAVNDFTSNAASLSGRPGGVINFYTTCTGINPLDTHLNKTATALAVIRNVTDEAIRHDNCTNPAALQTLSTTGAAAAVTSSNLLAEQACPRLQGFYLDLADNSICDSMIQGLFELWAVHVTAAALLYAAMYFTSHVKQKCKILILMDEEGAVKAIPLGPPLSPSTV